MDGSRIVDLPDLEPDSGASAEGYRASNHYPAMTLLGNDQQANVHDDTIAEEVPVALVYNGISHAVMLASPSDLEDFALGFSLTEGILRQAGELYEIEREDTGEGISLNLRISSERFIGLKERRRNLAGRTGCGLCGTESLSQVARPCATVRSGLRVAPSALFAAFAAMRTHQSLVAQTGAGHAAAFADVQGNVSVVREDVGRHNALDKLLGAVVRAKIDPANGIVLVTSRASYEMVQKTGALGIPIIAAISAPTGLAIRHAEASGITLAGFVRAPRLTVYTHAERLQPSMNTIEPNAKGSKLTLVDFTKES